MRKKLQTAVMTLLGLGYIATDVWLSTFARLRLSDKILLDVAVTFGFIALGAIAYAAIGDDDDST